MKYYNINDYKKELKEAERLYNTVITAECIDGFGVVIQLNNNELLRVQAKARGIKNQLVSAAGKRLRAGVALKMLDLLAKDFDLTATLAARITQKLLGRAISRKILLERYATKNRTASNKSADFSALDKIAINSVFLEAKKELAALLAAATKARTARVSAAMGKQTMAQRMLSASAKKGLHNT